MDPFAIALGVMTVTLFGVAWQAWRLGNEQRDVALLGALGGLSGLGSVTTAIL